jgi:hypothetical protein
MNKSAPVHTDIFEQPVLEGSYVAVGRHNSLYICVVKKLNAKMIRVRNIRAKGTDVGGLVYSKETVKLSGEDIIAYILKHA